MTVLLIRRLVQLVVVLLVVTFLSYWLINLLPGDPAMQILGFGGDAQAIARVRHQLGLDEPLIVRYVRWLGGLVHGDLGTSYISSMPVGRSLAERMPVTLELLVLAQVLALAVAVPLGMVSAKRAGRPADRAITTISFGLLSTPVFVSGVLLIMVFAVQMPLLPATGYTPLSSDPVDNLRTLALPTVTLAAGQLAVYTRLLRSDLIATLQEDYILLARARGFSPRRIMWQHALRPSAITLVTAIGLNLGALIGGSVIIEQLFGLPGIGRLIVEAIFSRDYLVVQGGVMVVAVGYVIVNFAVDLLYSGIDPRIRRAG